MLGLASLLNAFIVLEKHYEDYINMIWGDTYWG